MTPIPQFTAKLIFHFREHGANRQRWFMFDEGLHRRVPMKMEGVDGLHTVGMWVDTPGKFKEGDAIVVRCVVLAPEIFNACLKPGVHFELWDAGFLASGTVLTPFRYTQVGRPPSPASKTL